MKYIKTFVLFITIFFYCFSVAALEYKNFDINGYYTPDIVRNALDLNFNLNDNYFQNRNQTDSISQNNFRWFLNPVFSRFINTRKKIFSVSSGGTTEGYIENSSSSIKSKSVDNNAFVNLNYAHFFTKNYYLSFEFGANYNGEDNYYENNSSHTLGKRNEFNLNSSIAIGKGRIENVTDARQAVYILESLSQNGSLNRSLTKDEIFRFAQTISKVKNKRFLDARLHKIDEITTVDSFFVTNNLIKTQDARYFTMLYDMWDFGGLYQRYSGQSFEIGIAPFWRLIKTNSEYNNTYQINSDETIGRELYLKYRYEKSTGQNWQHSLNVMLGFNLNRLTFDTKFGEGANSIQSITPFGSVLNAAYNLSYYPSTRTRFSLTAIQKNTEKIFETVLLSPNQDKYTVQFTNYTYLNLSADYYVSQQLRLTGGAGFSFNNLIGNNDTSNYSRFAFGIGFGLVYSIF